MMSLRAKPLAWLLSIACGYASAAESETQGLKPARDGLLLKLQPFLLRGSADANEASPIFIEAGRISGRQDREIEAEGAVRLRRREQAIHAENLRYDKTTNEVHARGAVRLEQRGDVIDAESLRLNLVTDRGELDKPRYQVTVNNTRGRGEGERVVVEGPDKYRVLGGNYTSCEVGNDDWFVRARDFEIDKDRQLGTARDASIVFLGQTILYTPYLSFSLDRQRKSGLLSPTVGTTGGSGLDISVPVYWNIAPNRDATLTPRLLQKRGLMLGSEFRYLEASRGGEARAEILPSDRARGDDDRYFMALRHNETLGGGWVGNLNLQKVSDDFYFTDLSTRIATTSQSLLPREGSLARNGAWWNGGTWSISGLIQRWQTLQTDPLKPLLAPYSRSQMQLNAAKPDLGLLDFEFSGSLVDFGHPTLTTGKRAIAYPTISAPLQTSYGYVTPRLGMHMTQYYLDQTAIGDRTPRRVAPIFSTEGGVVFERDAGWYGQALRQTLEPKFYYVYIPTRQQNLIPNFDSGLQDINFATLYSENQFSGGDRINDANQLTLGISSRFLQADSGIERLRFGIAQRYYFKTQEVVLPGVAARDSNNSDLLAFVSGAIARNWTAEAGWQYSTSLSQTQRANANVRFQPEPGKVINVGYRYTNGSLLTPNQTQNVLVAGQPVNNNTLRQIDLSTQWPLTSHLSGVARWNYSLQDSRLVEGLAGLEYDGGCWSFRVVAHRFATSTERQVNSVFLQLELNGLSKLGSNTLDLLRRNVSGYHRQDQPAGAFDEYSPER